MDSTGLQRLAADGDFNLLCGPLLIHPESTDAVVRDVSDFALDALRTGEEDMTRLIPVALLFAIVAVGCDGTRSVGERTYYNGNGSVTRVEGQYDPGTGSTTYHTERYGSVGSSIKPNRKSMPPTIARLWAIS